MTRCRRRSACGVPHALPCAFPPFRSIAVAAALVLAFPYRDAGAQQAAPAVELYAVDGAHSLFDFTIRHLGFSRVRASFDGYSGHVLLDGADTTRSVLAFDLPVARMSTGNEARDRHLLTADFFDAAKYPSITFASMRIERAPGGYVAVGPLTIHGVTREQRIPVEISVGPEADQWGNRRFVAAGSFAVNRRDFDVVGPAFWARTIGDSAQVEFEIAGRQLNYDAVAWSTRRPSAGKLIVDGVAADGLEAGLARVRALWRNGRDADSTYDFSAQEFATAAGRLAGAGKFGEAAAVLEFALALPGANLPPDTRTVFVSRIGYYRLRLGDRDGARRAVDGALASGNPDTATLVLARYLGVREASR